MGNAIETIIRLQGEGAKDFLQKKGIQNIEADCAGNLILEEKIFFRPSEYWLVASTKNREVVVYSDWLRSKGKKRFRKVSINSEGVGRQQVTRGVELVVQTNAPVTVFQQNKR